MSEWKTYKLGDVGRIVTGKTPSTKDPENFGSEYPFITPRDMNTQKFIRGTERYLSEKAKLQLKNNILPEKTICVSCIGSDLGKVVMTSEESFTNQQLNSIICSKKFDPDFIYYTCLILSNKIRSIGKSSTAVPIVNKSQFSDFEFEAPENIKEQRQIAAILSSLDDKIELNLQMNQTLEAMAQAIFKEWFVDFNFPGFDGVLVDGLPKGWRVEKLANICTVKYGKDHKHLEDGEIPVYGSGGIMRYVKKSLYKNESILIPRKGTLSNLFYVKEAFWSVDTMFYTIINEDRIRKYLFFLLKSLNLASMNVGSAVPSLTTEVLNKIDIVVPENGLLEEFENVVSTFYSKIDENSRQIKSLTQTRDTLLPKLMSGQIAIQA